MPEGEKMSKSLGQRRQPARLHRDVYDPRAYRMVLLQSHYRSPITISGDTIDAATKRARRARLVRGAHGGRSRCSDPIRTCSRRSGRRWTTTSTRPRRRRCCSTPCAGPTPRSMPMILQRRVSSRQPTRSQRRSASSWDVWPTSPTTWPPRPRRSIEARADRDYAAADAIRAELQADGWTVETTKDGTAVRR